METVPQFISTTFKNVSEMVVATNSDLQIVFCNNATEDITYYQSEELIGTNVSDIFNGAKLNFNEISIDKSQELNLQIKAKTGIVSNVTVQISCLINERGAYIYLFLVYNVFEQNKLELKLENAIELNKALSHATNEALFFSDKGICIECNQKACEMFGYSYDELIGIFGTDVISEESKELVKNNMLKGYELPYEALALKKDGTKFWAEFQGRMFNFKGKPTRVTAVSDISHRKELETKQRFTEKNYKLLFDNMNEAFALHKIILDENNKPVDYEYIDVNPVFEKLTGLSYDRVIGKRLTEILPNIEKYWIEVFGNVALTGKPIEYTNYAKELGRYFDTRAYSPLHGYFAVAFTDATERIKIESEINFHNESLSSLVKIAQKHVYNYTDLIKMVVQEGMDMVKADCGAYYFYDADTGNYKMESIHDDICLEITEKKFGSVFQNVLLKKKERILNAEQISDLVKDVTCSVKSLLCVPSKGKGAIPLVFGIGYADSEFNVLEQKHLSMYFESAMHVIERQKYQDQVLEDKLKAEVYENRFAEIQKAGKIGWYEAILDKGLFQGSYETYMIFFDEHYEYPVGQEHLINAIHVDDRQYFFNTVSNGINNKLPEIEWEYRVVTPKSGIKHVYSKAFLNYDKNGNLIRRYGIVQDITDKKQIEIELKRNNERLESLFKMSQLTDLNTNELYEKVLQETLKLTNSKIGFIFQYNSKKKKFKLESYSKSVISESDLAEFKSLANSIDSKKVFDIMSKNKPIINNNAKLQPGLLQKVLENKINISNTMLVPVKITPETNLWTVVGTSDHDYFEADIHQISLLMNNVWKLIERQEYEQQLVKAKNKAQESDKLKTAFLANMSHEIRTPMNGILGFSELIIEDEIPDDKRKEYAGIIMESGKQLLSIVDDILDISKIEVGQVRIDKSKVDVKEVLTSLYSFFEPKTKQNNLKLNLNHVDDEVIITTDEQRLRQILTNLLSNAFKFTTEGEVSIGYSVNINQIEFYVKDSGIGIPIHMHDVIFERFRQVERTDSQGYRGTGLGLSISQKLVELLGGKIWVKSEEGYGSTFYFTLPKV